MDVVQKPYPTPAIGTPAPGSAVEDRPGAEASAAPTAVDAEQQAEQDLIAALQHGDALAFDVLVRRHGRAMLATARRMVGNDEEAQDVLQEAFLCAFRGIAAFAGKARLATWLHRVVVNAALMRLRSRRCRPERAIEDLLPQFVEDGHHLEPPCPFGDRAAAELESNENRALVRAAVEQLPPAYREIVLLRDIEGVSTEDAAQLLGTTGNAVKIRLHRARQALRTLLEHHFRETQP